MKNLPKTIILTGVIPLLIIVVFVETAVAKPIASQARQAVTGDVIIYGSNGYDNAEMIEINLSQNTTQQVGTASVLNQAMAQDPITQYVYYFERGTAGNLFAYFDPATQTNATVRNYDPAPGFFAKRMDFAPDGTLYMMDNLDQLYILDKITGDYTLLGAVDGMESGAYTGTGDMAFAPDGTLYVATYESIYTLDIDTLTPTLLFENMFDEPAGEIAVWTGLAYCDGMIYGSSGEGVAAIAEGITAIYRINPISGDMEKVINNVGVILNDLSSCQPKVEICELQDNTTYNFYIEPFTAVVDINSLGTLDCISMNRFNISHPEATTALDTGQYWSINGFNSGKGEADNFEVTLTLPTTFTADAQDKVCRYTGSGWECVWSSNTTNSVTRSGITEFSDWTVGNDAGPTAVTLQSITVKQNNPHQFGFLFGLLLLTIVMIMGYRKRFS